MHSRHNNRCLVTTNLIESPLSGVRMQTRRVCRWRDQSMAKRGLPGHATEKGFRRIMGYRNLWALLTIFGRN